MQNIIRYNWLDIINYTEYDCNKILRVFYFFYNKTYLTTKDFFIRNILHSTAEKCNYILNVGDLLNANINNTYKCIYLDLASQRNYIDYIFKNKKDVPIEYIDKYNINNLRNNPLLLVTDKYIELKFE